MEPADSNGNLTCQPLHYTAYHSLVDALIMAVKADRWSNCLQGCLIDRSSRPVPGAKCGIPCIILILLEKPAISGFPLARYFTYSHIHTVVSPWTLGTFLVSGMPNDVSVFPPQIRGPVHVHDRRVLICYFIL